MYERVPDFVVPDQYPIHFLSVLNNIDNNNNSNS